MKTLRPDELLAVEPGDAQVEAARHREFRADHVQHPQGREWFAASLFLTAHIDDVARSHPVPDLRSLAPRNRPRRRIGPMPEWAAEFEHMTDMELVGLMKEAHARAAEAQSQADARFRKVVAEMRYEHGWTVTRIAEQIELSVSQTSRLIKAGKDL